MKIGTGAKKIFRHLTLVLTLSALVIGQVPIAYADTLNTISGNLTDRLGNPIRYAMVCMKESQSSTILDVQADGNGHYSLDVPVGMYSIRICDNNGANLGTFVDPSSGNTDGTSFRSFVPDGVVNPYVVDASSGNTTQDLSFDTVEVGFVIKDANGTPVVSHAFQQISANSGDTTLLAGHPDVHYSTGPITVNTPRTDTNGTTRMVTLLRGVTYSSCTLDDTNENNPQSTCSTITPTDDSSTINITLPYPEPQTAPTTATISGNLTDSLGNHIKYAMVCMKESQSSTILDVQADGNGHYSLDVPVGMYSIRICDNNGANLGMFVDPNSGNSDGTGFRSFIPDGDVNPYVVDASGGNATQDLSFDTVKVGFVIKDANGTPVVSHAFQQIDAQTGNTTLLAGYPDVHYNTGQIAVNTPRTDANGATPMVTLIRGITYHSCTLDDTIENNTQAFCTTITPTADTETIHITLPYAEPATAPATPTGLSAQSPTSQHPALAWNSVSGASHYDVLRDGDVIGSPTTANFTDNAATDGSHVYSVKAVNSSNLGSDPSSSVTVVYDTTAPTITYSVAPATNSNGWNKDDVTITFACDDSLSGIQSCPQPMTVSTDGANQTATGTATDNAGNSATATASVSLDKTLPSISANLSLAANANGWNNDDVTVGFTCNDTLSGIQSCSQPTVVSAETANQEVVGSALDNADNIASTTKTVKLDKTAPTITYTLSQAPNGVGNWNNDAVTVTFACDDTLSGIQSCSAPVTVSGEGASQIVVGTAMDNAGNSTAVPVTLNIDETSPVITYTVAQPANSNGWYNSDVTLSFSCFDALSGVQSCQQPITLGIEGANQTTTGTALDNANNNTSVTTALFNIDKTAPTIAASVDAQPNASGWNKGDVTTTYTCSDSLSGVQNCPAPITVSTEGANQASVQTATDNAGNTASTSTNLSIDKTAPTITASVSTLPNLMGWNSGSVTITFNCGDALSGVASCTSPVTVSTEGANQVVTGTAADNAGNVTTTTAIVSIDNTKPTIVATQTPAANASGWNNTNVTVSFTCHDSLSGIYSCSSPVTLSTEGTSKSATGTAVDNAGNANTVTLSGINIDKTAPTASNAVITPTPVHSNKNSTETISASADDNTPGSGVIGGEYYLDTEPGVGNGTAMTYSNGQLNATAVSSTFSKGNHILYIRSKDAAGNWSTTTSTSFKVS